MDNYKVYEGSHPAVVPEDDFLRFQEIWTTKASSSKVKKEFELQNAFVGLLFCANCGKQIGRTTQSRTRGDGLARFRCVNAGNCHNVSSDYEIVEKEIINALRPWLRSCQMKIDTVEYAKDVDASEEILTEYNCDIQKLNKHLENAFNLVE